MRQPVVSIITPSYNRADVVRETADSILAQTYPHWEWVIVDDGSTDGSFDLLASMARTDERIRLLRRDREPKGACTCRNIGVLRSKGSHLLFLDTDDILSPHCLERRVAAAAAAPESDFIIFPMLMFRSRLDDMNLLWNTDSGVDDLERILSGDAICQGTGTLWRKDSFVRVGMWDESLVLWQDVELHLRSLLSGLVYTKRMDLPPDVYLRVSYVSISRTGFHSPEKIDSRIRVLGSTIDQMVGQGLMERYRTALRHMYTDIFLSAANGRQAALLGRLRTLEAGWGLFLSSERRVFQAYAIMQIFRLYKFSALKRYLTGRIRSFVPQCPSNIGKVAYEPS